MLPPSWDEGEVGEAGQGCKWLWSGSMGNHVVIVKDSYGAERASKKTD